MTILISDSKTKIEVPSGAEYLIIDDVSFEAFKKVSNLFVTLVVEFYSDNKSPFFLLQQLECEFKGRIGTKVSVGHIGKILEVGEAEYVSFSLMCSLPLSHPAIPSPFRGVLDYTFVLYGNATPHPPQILP